MPFESERQRRYMWAKHPDIARRWTKKYGSSLKAAVKREKKKRKRKKR